MPIDLAKLTVREGRKRGGARRRRYFKPDGTEVCGAQLRGKGESVRCSQMRGLAPTTGRCRVHGGHPDAGRPPETGRWSNAAGRLAEAYERAKEDPDLEDIRRPLAVLDAQVEAALKGVDELDCPDFRREALARFKEAQQAQAEDEDEGKGAGKAMERLGELLEAGAAEDDAQRHLVQMTERFAKRLERAWEIKLSRSNAVNARDLVSIIGKLVEAVQLAAPPEVARRVLHQLDGEFRELAGMLPPRECETE